MIAMLITAIPANGMVSADTTTDEYTDVYYSDLFWGYSPSYFKTENLANYRRSTYDVNFKIYTDYLDDPDCIWSVIKTSMLSTTDIKSWLQLMSSVPDIAPTDYTYNNAIDNANEMLAASMLDVVSNRDTLENGTALSENIETMFGFFDVVGKTVLTPDVIKELDSSGIFSAFFGEIYDLDVLPELKNTNLNVVLDELLANSDKYAEMASIASDAFEASKVIYVALMIENYRMETINSIIEMAPENSDLYNGMCRLKSQIEQNFGQYFIENYLTEKALDSMVDSLKDLSGGMGEAYDAICTIIKTIDVIFFSDIPDLDAILTQRVLCNYADGLYNIILDAGNGMVYDEMTKAFKVEDVRNFEYIFDMFLSATECALNASREMALDSNESDLEKVISNTAYFNYNDYILGIREHISRLPVSQREYKHFTNWNFADGMYFADASDDLEDNAIYMCDGAFRGNITLNSYANLVVDENTELVIQGNVDCSREYGGITNNGILHIVGDVSLYRTLNNDSSNFFANNGELDVDGDCKVYNFYMSEPDAVLRLGGDWTTRSVEGMTDGTVVFDGREQQNISLIKARNFEVTNPCGISASMMYLLGGEFDLHSNLLELGESSSVMASAGSTFVTGSDYKRVTVTGYYETFELKNDIKADIIVDSYTTLRIPEGCDVTVYGNITASREYGGCVNDGKLHIVGDVSLYRMLNNDSSNYFTNNGELDVDGDFKSYRFTMSEEKAVFNLSGGFESRYSDGITAGTFILDGETLQTLPTIQLYNLIVKNPQGIRYNGNVTLLGGRYDLCANTLDNNGFSTIVKTGTVLEPGSDYKDVTVGYDATLTLDYPVKADFVINGSVYGGVIEIPEGSAAVVDGNITTTLQSALRVNGELVVNGDISGSGSCTNNGLLDVNGNISVTSGFSYGTQFGSFYMSMPDSILRVSGDFTTESLSQSCYIDGGSVVFDGDKKQTVSGIDAPIFIIENASDEGVVFGNKITPDILFDHKGNVFTLYNDGDGSVFADYDADGLKDNIDPFPTVFDPCATDHAWSEWQEVKAPSCTAEGLKERECVNCEATESAPIEIIEHNWSDWVGSVPATCVTVGVETRSCVDCSASQERTTQLGDHAWGEWYTVRESACIDGLERSVCTECESVRENILWATGEHVYGEKELVIEAGCEIQAVYRESCIYCDYFKFSNSPELGHVWGDWSIRYDATCVTEGSKVRYCQRCSMFEYEVIPATGVHVFDEWITTRNPDCENIGEKIRYCRHCDQREYEYSPALGHDITFKPGYAATCRSGGMRDSYYCSRCNIYWLDESLTQVTSVSQLWIDISNEHSWSEWYEQFGKLKRVCEVCQSEEWREIVQEEVHEFGDWKTYIPAGCETQGESIRVCNKCGAFEKKTIPAVGHIIEHTPANTPTCKADGNVEYWCCINCKKNWLDGDLTNEVDYSKVVLAANNNHLWSEWSVSDGQKKRICSLCSAIEIEDYYANPFTDVKDGKWYTDGILWCYYSGYMAGTSETVFDYKGNVTRAMFVTILAQIDGSDISGYSEMSFSDVKPGKWYSNAIEWAYQNGYAAGLGEGIFGYKQNVSREQIALFFYTYSEKNGIDVAEEADLSGYADLGRVHSWALDAMEWAVAKGLIGGTSETTLSPRDSATRAEIALIVKNYVESVKN